MQSESRLRWIAPVLCSVLVLVAFFSIPLLPTMDGPHHVLGCYLRNHYNDPGSSWAQYFEQADPLTGMGFCWVFSALERWLPWRMALQATLAFGALALAWSVLLLSSMLSSQKVKSPALLGFAACFSWPLYMGFFSFCLSSVLAVLALAWVVGRSSWRWLDRVAVGSLWFVCALAHLFPAETLGLALLVCTVHRHWNSGRLLREMFALALMGLAPVLVAVLSLTVAGDLGTTAGASVEWLPIGERLLGLGTLSVSGPAWRWGPVLLSAVLLLGAVFARWKDETLVPEARALALTSVLLFVLYLCTPLHTKNWDFFSPRFLYFAMLFALVLPAPERWSRWWWSVSLVLALLSLGWGVKHHRWLATQTRDGLSGLSQPLRRTGPRLPIVLDPTVGTGVPQEQWDVPFAEPLFNLGPLYSVAHGGVVPYFFANVPGLHEYLFKRSVRFAMVPDRRVLPVTLWNTTDPTQRTAVLNEFLTAGTFYEDVLLLAPQRVHALFVRRGYVVDHEQGAFMIAHYRGCSVRVESTVSMRDGLELVGGFPLVEQPAMRVRLPRNLADFSIPNGLCGPGWYRLEQNGTVEASLRCAAPTQGVVRCETAQE